MNYSKRINMLKSLLKENNIDAVFIDKLEDYIYLSGFTGTDAKLFITQEENFIITDFRYIEQAKEQAQDYKIIKQEGKFPDEIVQIMERLKIRKVGVQDKYITYSEYKKYDSIKNDLQLLSIDELLASIKMIKDNDEIEKITMAVEIADEAFSHIIKYIKPGMSEWDVAIEIEYFMKKHGAKNISFETIVASGKRSSMPHGVASQKIIENGDIITLDYGAIYDNYCSDMTRTIFVGEPKRELLKIYNIVLEAQLAAIKNAQKGKTGKEIDNIAREIITSYGYGEYFGHALGHGVGVEVHEAPRISKSGHINMGNGMPITIEPGIYIPGLGGVRIEDLIVINDDKPIVLTKSTKEIVII